MPSIARTAVLRSAAAVLTSLIVGSVLAPAVHAVHAEPSEPSEAVTRSSTAKPVERTVRYVVVQRSRVSLDIASTAGIRRARVVGTLPGRMSLGKRVLRGWAPQGRTVVRLRGISTWEDERGKRLRLKVVVVGRPQVARRGTALLTRAPGGAPGNGASYRPLVSEDGSTVVFSSEATNLVTPRLGRARDFTARVFAWDRESGRTELVSVAPDGSPRTGETVGLSADGSRVLFRSGTKLHLRDRTAGTTRELATVGGSGRVGALSADGDLVTYLSGGRALRLDLRTATTTDLGVATFTAVSPSGRYLAVHDGGRFYVWDATTRTVTRELDVQEPEPWCRWVMTELTDDAQRGMVFAGCDRSVSEAVVDLASLTWLARGAVLDATADASWIVTANGRGRIEAGPVGGAAQLVSSQPSRAAQGEGSWARRTPSVAIAGAPDVVVWSTFGGNVVRNAYSGHDQIYFWTSAG